MVVLMGVLWGMNWPAVKFMLTELPPITMRAIAFPSAALLLGMIARTLGHRLCPPRRELLPMLLAGLFVIFGFNIGSTFGQVFTQTSKAAIIAYTMPAITAALAVVFLKERLHLRLVLALLIGMAGLAVLASRDFSALLRDPTGPGIMLAAALSWSIGNIALKSRTWTLSPLAMAMWFFAISSVLAWPLVLIFEPLADQHMPSLPVLLTLGYHILGPMVVCYLLWTVLLGRLPATVAAISTLTAPIVGVSSAVVLLGDELTWQIVTALALIVGSIALTLGRPHRLPEAE
jgi:drug/metabolite transporter (DMT)-like permease